MHAGDLLEQDLIAECVVLACPVRECAACVLACVCVHVGARACVSVCLCPSVGLPVRRTRCLYGTRAALGEMVTPLQLEQGRARVQRVIDHDKQSILSLFALSLTVVSFSHSERLAEALRERGV